MPTYGVKQIAMTSHAGGQAHWHDFEHDQWQDDEKLSLAAENRISQTRSETAQGFPFPSFNLRWTDRQTEL